MPRAVPRAPPGIDPRTSPSVAAGTPVTAMPADPAGHGPPTRPPPGPARAREPAAPAAAAQAGDMTRTGGTGQLAVMATACNEQFVIS